VRRRGGRRWRLRLAGALVSGAVGIGGCGSGPSRPAATAPGPTPTTVALDWSRSASASLDIGGGPTSTLSAVVAPEAGGNGDWLIAGTRIGADGQTTATVWSSPNGVDWTATALAGADGRALAATSWGMRTVVVGSVGRGSTERAAVWTTSDPDAGFTPAPDAAALVPTVPPATAGDPTAPDGTTVDGTAGPGIAAMDVVTAGTQGVFAAGSVSGRQAVWYSTDGADWVRLAGAEKVIARTPGAVVTALLVTPTAVLAAGTSPDGTHTHGALWSSPDGINWRRLVPAGDPFGGGGDHRIDGLTVEATGSIVAVGAVRAGPSWLPASWISPAGSVGTWSQPSEALPTSTQPQPTVGGSVGRAVTTTSDGLVAVGGSSTVQRVWTSGDGRAWSESPLPRSIAGAADWSADLVGAAGSTTVVVDTVPGQPRVLVDVRGRWQDVSSSPAIFGPVAAVATPGALVVDGSRLVLAVDVYRPGSVIGAGTPSVDVVSSSDGAHWRRLSAGDSMTQSWVDSMSVISGSLVAVGYSLAASGARAATVWTSETGRTWHLAGRFGRGSRALEEAATVTDLGSVILAAGSAPVAASPRVDATPTAHAWLGGTAGWTAVGLDATAGVGAETVLGSCRRGATTVLVGRTTRRGIVTAAGATAARSTGAAAAATTSTVAVAGSPAGPDGQATDGTVAQTWATTTGTSWTAGTISPLSGAGGGEEMDGCAPTGAGFVAWGEAPGPGGLEAPALWRSIDGAAWILEHVPSLTVTGASPVTGLARSATIWVAVSGGRLAAVANPADPVTGTGDPIRPPAAPVAASGADGATGVLASGDSGITWNRVPATTTSWAAAGLVTTDLVQLLGSRAVVAGEVDDRVAVWVGEPGP